MFSQDFPILALFRSVMYVLHFDTMDALWHSRHGYSDKEREKKNNRAGVPFPEGPRSITSHYMAVLEVRGVFVGSTLLG